MKTLWYLPLTYLAGVHGFLFFAPYLALFLTIAHYTRRTNPHLIASRPSPIPISA